RYADPSVLALFSALLVFRLLPRGFANRELREHLAPLLGKDPSELTQGRMTYQLRRLRLHGLIVRLPATAMRSLIAGCSSPCFSPAATRAFCGREWRS